MLKSLFISRYALIDHLDISFDGGFTVITGETGAGKSIILGALALVLGQRADSKSIQTGADKCVIEAAFDISAYQMDAFFSSHDIEYDATHCIIRREVMSSGKSRAFINDTPAPLTVVKALGDRLIDVHSQHQNLLLSDSRFQLKVVDIMAQTAALLAPYKTDFLSYVSLKEQLQSLQSRAVNNQKEEEYIRFQAEELKNAQLIAGEQEEWERELEEVSHAEEIKSTLFNVGQLLDGEDQSVLTKLKETLSANEALISYYPKASGYVERLRAAYIDLKDLVGEVHLLKEDVEFNPDRQEWLTTRLNTLYSLQQKHHVSTVEELIALSHTFEGQLKEIESYDEQIAVLKKELDAAYQSLVQQALTIREERHKAAEVIATRLVEQMVLLGMPNSRFQIAFTEREQPMADGMDEISFLFSANKNEPLKPVSQTASGGEISRLMLCVKSMIAGFAALPSIIFDEIDTGISGEVADKMADIMQQLGKKMQVITITHLPQIAAKGKGHFFVYKEDTAERTLTRIRQLNQDERLHEVARLLSGASLTQAALLNAETLLKEGNN